ncbi:MAG: MFS transporter [Candidatus Krumholzibacteriota bacterium]|nr:MFS transporter [Candidatus Krumholzibacteriota bacterium]
MIKRFSLYGFLKNQRYFEPFIVLYFLELGLSFTEIGLLVAFREICINLIEVPSGALADIWGRRRCMVVSFAAYIFSFALFAAARSFAGLFPPLFLFAAGEAFRTGTHKAIIFTWLRLEGRTPEKARVYGYTRSWSKIGSAVSIVFATLFVFFARDYRIVFLLSIPPYAVGIVNFLLYPAALDGRAASAPAPGDVWRHLARTIHRTAAEKPLRRLVAESMGFEGIFRAVKDFIQPLIASAALALPLAAGLDDTRRTALLVGLVYVVLHLGSAAASRRAHVMAERAGGEERASRLLWRNALVLYAALAAFLYAGVTAAAVVLFVFLHLLQNVWRPLLVSRFDAFADERSGATVLSIENQAKTISTMLVAPAVGLAVDLVRRRGIGGEFWPVGIAGAVVALFFVWTGARRGSLN